METIESLAPWFYEFDLGPLGRTESQLPADVKPIHQTRLEMVQEAISLHFSPERLRSIRFDFDRTPRGVIAVDDVGLSRAR